MSLTRSRGGWEVATTTCSESGDMAMGPLSAIDWNESSSAGSSEFSAVAYTPVVVTTAMDPSPELRAVSARPCPHTCPADTVRPWTGAVELGTSSYDDVSGGEAFPLEQPATNNT